MSFYSFLETSVILIIGVLSMYQVMNILVPRVTHRMRTSIALRLSRAPGSHWRSALATRLGGATPASGCSAGCGGGCNGCSIAARIHPPLAGDDKSSR